MTRIPFRSPIETQSNTRPSCSGNSYADLALQAQVDTTQLPHRSRCLKIVWLWEMHSMVNEQINLARDAFQSANVIQQLQIEALRGELRLRGLFSAQPRPTSLAYESTLAVLLKHMSDNSSSIALSKTMMSNPHKYELPSMLPRDLGQSVEAGLLAVSKGTYTPTAKLSRLIDRLQTQVKGLAA